MVWTGARRQANHLQVPIDYLGGHPWPTRPTPCSPATRRSSRRRRSRWTASSKPPKPKAGTSGPKRWSYYNRARNGCSSWRRRCNRCATAPGSPPNRPAAPPSCKKRSPWPATRTAPKARRVPLRRRVHRRPLVRPARHTRTPRQRLDVFNRAAAHQTTADNPGLIPEPIVGAARQLRRRVPPDRQRARGPRRCPAAGSSGPAGHPAHRRRRSRPPRRRSWSSRKMLIDKVAARWPPTAATSTCPVRTSTGRRRRSWTWSSTTSPASTRSTPRRRPASR